MRTIMLTINLLHLIADYVNVLMCADVAKQELHQYMDFNDSDCRMKVLVREWDKVQANIVGYPQQYCRSERH
jgi:hypothetical protein